MNEWIKEGAPCVVLRKGFHGFEAHTVVHIEEIEEDGTVHLSAPAEKFRRRDLSPAFDGYHKMRATISGIIEHFLVDIDHPMLEEAVADVRLNRAKQRLYDACQAHLGTDDATAETVLELQDASMELIQTEFDRL